MRPEQDIQASGSAAAGMATSTTTTNFSGAPRSSPWQTPVPYLFGGLGVMLGLVAFALLILACSYWNISFRRRESGEDADHPAADGGVREGKPKDGAVNPPSSSLFEDQIVVVMAGQPQPTFLATLAPLPPEKPMTLPPPPQEERIIQRPR